MALPNYASKVERVAYAGYLAFCGGGAVLFNRSNSDHHPVIV